MGGTPDDPDELLRQVDEELALEEEAAKVSCIDLAFIFCFPIALVVLSYYFTIYRQLVASVGIWLFVKCYSFVFTRDAVSFRLLC